MKPGETEKFYPSEVKKIAEACLKQELDEAVSWTEGGGDPKIGDLWEVLRCFRLLAGILTPNPPLGLSVVPLRSMLT